MKLGVVSKSGLLVVAASFAFLLPPLASSLEAQNVKAEMQAARARAPVSTPEAQLNIANFFVSLTNKILKSIFLADAFFDAARFFHGEARG